MRKHEEMPERIILTRTSCHRIIIIHEIKKYLRMHCVALHVVAELNIMYPRNVVDDDHNDNVVDEDDDVDDCMPYNLTI